MNLAIAFGARGSGAALAHYEPERNVINLTKMKGAGCLAHEWGHALDNKIGIDCGAKRCFTESYCKRELNPELYDATALVVRTLKERIMTDAEYVEYARETVESNKEKIFSIGRAIENKLAEDGISEQHIKNIGSLMVELANMEDHKRWFIASEAINKELQEIHLESKISTAGYVEMAREAYSVQIKKSRLQDELDEYSESGRIEKRRAVKSQFYEDALKLDENRSKPYYSTTVEMFARAFESYVFDKAKIVGFMSEYLVHSVSSDIYERMNMGSPYPKGRDRRELYKAFERLFEVYRKVEFDGKGFQYNTMYKSENLGTDTYKDEKMNKRTVKKAVMEGEISSKSTAEEIRNKVEQMNKESNSEISNIKDIKCSADLRSYISYNVKGIRKDKVSLYALYAKLELNNTKHWEDIIPVNSRMGHTKCWGVKNGCLVVLKGASEDKKSEAIVEAVANLVIRGNSEEIEMVREGVIFTLCKMYKLDVRTYCVGKRFESLCRDRKSLEQYLDIVVKKAAELNGQLL